MTALPTSISESQIALVLQRAAEIDAAGDRVTVEELRRIAAEAGINPEATEHALQELFASREFGLEPAMAGSPPIRADAPVPPSPRRIVAGGAMGVALGVVISLGNILLPLGMPNLLGLAGLAGAAAYLFRRAIRSMKRGSQLNFQMENVVLWFGTAVGAAFSYPLLADDGLFVVTLIWLVAAVVGGIIIRFGPRDDGS